MALGDRHQKKDVEAALKRAERAGLKVTRKKSGHTWGLVICCPCDDHVSVSCTPRSTGAEAKRIDEFVRDHQRCAS
ncbi:hypothetical protein [Streptomyces uncialis]|uniref:hypothetical protein n=1 Tax=Streptomyces uncialis TaxID=1048205 RepID=UPI00093F4C7A|nr:hypothetical protein [Streptomyces uncialis]MCX4661934.1 hypothetical protein [Streptomyces uncialis]WTE09204.1 hypothetical protein OG924_02105 [Streptomyces uncialis]